MFKPDNNNLYKIAIVGSGIVGKATGMVLSRKGFDVTFVDRDSSILNELKSQGYKAFLPQDLDATLLDVFFISVSTYTDKDGRGLKSIRLAAANIGKSIKNKVNKSLLVIRSTVVPGTTENVIIPTVEKYSGKKAGVDFDVCVNPEYLRERTAEADFEKPWVVVIGQSNDGRAGKILEQIYSWVDCPILKVTIQEAEIQKFIHNVYNANKISFFNEMRIFCEHLGLNSDNIFPLVVKSAESMWNPQYGTANLGPFGGSCLPKDANGLSRFARSKHLNLKLLNAVIAVNEIMKRRKKL